MFPQKRQDLTTLIATIFSCKKKDKKIKKERNKETAIDNETAGSFSMAAR